MPFSNLGLTEVLLRAVAEQGYEKPTPIQSQAIPAVLAGRDLLAAAQTGTGKTAAFTLPLLQRLMSQPADAAKPRRIPRALVLTPTRELAAQVGDSVRTYGRHTPLRAATVFGGVGMQPQIDALRRGTDIVVATPGRLLDHVDQRTIDLRGVDVLVLDEADRMLDMGFIPDIRRVLGLLPKVRQNLLFSATFSEEIRKLAGGLLNDPLRIDVAPRNAPAEGVNQRIYQVDKGAKRALLAHLIRSQGWGQTLVFTRTKHGANRLGEQMEKDGFLVAVIHGNKSQTARTRALADFKANRAQVLVATDIAARGLDIEELPHVVNYELPNVPSDYVHRIGRTGRAGASGEAVSLVCGEERAFLRDIERLLGRKLPAEAAEGFAPGTMPAADAGGEPHPAHRRPSRPAPRHHGHRHGNAPGRRSQDQRRRVP